VRSLAIAYTRRMPPHAFFSHTTAAQLHAIPLPLDLEVALPLHVSVPDPRRAPAGRLVRGHRVRLDAVDVSLRRALRMTSLERTLCDLAPLLTDEDLLAAGDNILWRKRLLGNRATACSLTATLARYHGRRGTVRLTELTPHLSSRADSAPESVFRLRFMRAGFPRTLVNEPIYSASGVFIAQPDLQFDDYRMTFDYEGDHHRTDAKQWRTDLARVPRLQDAGWHHTRISAADLEDSTELLSRIRRLLTERGWAP